MNKAILENDFLDACRSGNTLFVNKYIGEIEDLNKICCASTYLRQSGIFSYSSAAIYAAQCKTPEILKILIEHGVDLNQADTDGKTPLYVAAKNGNKEMYDLIKSHGGR